MKTRLAEIFANHLGEARIIFYQEDPVSHGSLIPF